MYNSMTNGPPIVSYEQVIRPVEMSRRDQRLNEQDRRQELRERRKEKRRKKTSNSEKELLFEPMLGKLFDYSA